MVRFLIAAIGVLSSCVGAPKIVQAHPLAQIVLTSTMLNEAVRALAPLQVTTAAGDLFIRDLFTCGVSSGKLDVIFATSQSASSPSNYRLQAADCADSTTNVLAKGTSSSWVAVSHAILAWHPWVLTITVKRATTSSTTSAIGTALEQIQINLPTDDVALRFGENDPVPLNMAATFTLYGANISVYPDKVQSLDPWPITLSPDTYVNSYYTLQQDFVAKMVKDEFSRREFALPDGRGIITGISYAGFENRINIDGTFMQQKGDPIPIKSSWTGADLKLVDVSLPPDPDTCNPPPSGMPVADCIIRVVARAYLNRTYDGTPFRPHNTDDEPFKFSIGSRRVFAVINTHEAISSSDSLKLIANTRVIGE